MAKSVKTISLFVFLTLITPVFAQFNDINTVFSDLGGQLSKILNDENAVLILVVILFYLIFYSVFSLAASRIKLFEGEGGTGLSKSAKLLGNAFAGLSCLGIFALGGQDLLKNKLPEILATVGTIGALVVSVVFYAIMRLFVLKGESKFMGIPAWAASLIPTAATLWLFGTLTSTATRGAKGGFIKTVAAIFIFVIIIAALIKIFGNRSAKSEKKAEARLEHVEEEIVAEEEKDATVQATVSKREERESELAAHIENKGRDEDQIMHEQEIAVNQIQAYLRQLEQLPQNRPQLIAIATQLTEKLEGFDVRDEADIAAVMNCIENELQYEKADRAAIEKRINGLTTKINRLKKSSVNIRNKTIQLADHQELLSLKRQLDNMKEDAQRIGKLGELEEHIKNIGKEKEKTVYAIKENTRKLKGALQAYAVNPSMKTLANAKDALKELDKLKAIEKKDGESWVSMMKSLKEGLAKEAETEKKQAYIDRELANRIKKIETEERSGTLTESEERRRQIELKKTQMKERREGNKGANI